MNLAPEMQAKVDAAVQLMVDDVDIQALVKEVEGSLKTTKGNYGRYMSFLGQFDKVSAFVISKAMVKLGADSYGVGWAMKLIGGVQ